MNVPSRRSVGDIENFHLQGISRKPGDPRFGKQSGKYKLGVKSEFYIPI
jgi:hypothetical protein